MYAAWRETELTQMCNFTILCIYHAERIITISRTTDQPSPLPSVTTRCADCRDARWRLVSHESIAGRGSALVELHFWRFFRNHTLTAYMAQTATSDVTRYQTQTDRPRLARTKLQNSFTPNSSCTPFPFSKFP